MPINCEINIYDPWVPAYLAEKAGCKPVELPELLSQCHVLSVFARVTSESQGCFGHAELSMIRRDAIFL